jgi:general L-amino acid transport system permease protein
MLPTGWPSLAILIVPGVIMYFLLGQPVGLERPELKGFNFQGGVHLRLSLIALWFALAIYTGAFIAENVRAGIQAISKGQTEAAGALGLRPGRIMNLVILPQALRVIIPPLISQYLNITKNSSLAIAVGYMDITGTLGGITLNQTGRAIEAIMLLMLFYLIVSLSISVIMNIYNNSVKLKER